MRSAELFDFVRRAGTERSTAKLFAELTRFVGRSFDAHRISLYLAEGDDLVPFVAEYGSDRDDTGAYTRWREIRTWRPSFTARFRAGETAVHVPDPATEVGADLVEAFGILPFTALALAGRPGLLGALVVEGEPERLRAQEEDLVDLAGIVTLALENARAFEEQALRRREAEAFAAIAAALAESEDPARVLVRVARDAAELTGFERGTILLFDGEGVVPAMSRFADEREERDQWNAFRRLPPAALAAARGFVDAHAEPVAFSSRSDLAAVMGPGIVERFRVGSALVLPLVAWSEALGVLVLDRSDEGPIHLDQQRIAVGIAAQASTAIGVSRLLARERELVGRLRTADEAKTTFIASVSHELRTPLTSIIGFADMLAGMTGSAEEREFAGYIVRESRHLENLIANLLDSSRIEAGRLSLDRCRVDVAGVAGDAVDLVGYVFPDRAGDIRLTAGPAFIDGDPARLRQVVVNLVENAAKYSRAGDPVLVEVATSGGLVRVVVEDGGPGIPAADREVVFERFRRLAGSGRSGTGMGLFLVRQLVEAHGGRVWCEPGRTAGTRFVVELPPAPLNP